jgi:hypothetical protein
MERDMEKRREIAQYSFYYKRGGGGGQRGGGEKRERVKDELREGNKSRHRAQDQHRATHN